MHIIPYVNTIENQFFSHQNIFAGSAIQFYFLLFKGIVLLFPQGHPVCTNLKTKYSLYVLAKGPEVQYTSGAM